MSLMTALYSGASGLEASSLELSVVGDNIANGNTVGFKGSRAAFSDAMAQNLIGDTGVDGGQRGLGVKLQVVQKILTQGALVNTGNATDIGIEGSGFFAVNGNSNEPGTCTTSTSLLDAPARSSASTAAVSNRSVIKLLKRLATIPNRKPAALNPPSIFPVCISRPGILFSARLC